MSKSLETAELKLQLICVERFLGGNARVQSEK